MFANADPRAESPHRTPAFYEKLGYSVARTEEVETSPIRANSISLHCYGEGAVSAMSGPDVQCSGSRTKLPSLFRRGAELCEAAW
jgi:hypothetical protein